jgi:hypothetical protein
MSDDARWLDVTAGAAFLSLRPDIFLRKVREGLIPAPSIILGKRSPRWDRDRLDAIMMGGGTGSTNAREAVRAAAVEIERGGRRGRFGTGSR